jgi:hypothetical protein
MLEGKEDVVVSQGTHANIILASVLACMNALN